VVFEVGEGGSKAESFVEGVFVDTQDKRTLKAEAFGGLALSELAVDTRDGGRPNPFHPSHGGGSDTLVVLFKDARAEGLGGSTTREQARKWWDKSTTAIPTLEAPRVNDQLGRVAKTVKMPGSSPIAALAAEAAASAAKALLLSASIRSKVKVELILALAFEQPIALNANSVIHRGHGGGSYRLMSPIFDQEPSNEVMESNHSIATIDSQ
jgi:hypothetical protein